MTFKRCCPTWRYNTNYLQTFQTCELHVQNKWIPHVRPTITSCYSNGSDKPHLRYAHLYMTGGVNVHPHLIHGSLGPQEFTLSVAYRLTCAVRPFLQGSRLYQHRHVSRPRQSFCSSRPHLYALHANFFRLTGWLEQNYGCFSSKPKNSVTQYLWLNMSEYGYFFRLTNRQM